jgi:hypothetical protein
LHRILPLPNLLLAGMLCFSVSSSVRAGNVTGGTEEEAEAAIARSAPPPGARARRIAQRRDRIEGPLAHGRSGDYLLENEVARFIIQDAPQRDMWSVGQFGGNLIDAELRSHPGRDNFLELQPAVNIETVINAQSVEILNDGKDGGAAVVRSCGPDDLLDFINPSTNLRDFGFEPPASADDADYEVEGCTEYILEAGVPYLRLVTTIYNNAPQDLGLFVGDFVNAAGEVDPWSVTADTPLVSGGGIGESLTGSLEGVEYVGFGNALGTNYSFVPEPFEGSSLESDFLTASGVTVLLQNASIVGALLGSPPAFVVPAGGSRSFTRYFGVSDGSSGGAAALALEVRGRSAGRLQGCVSVGGEAAPGARVAVMETDGTEPLDLVSHFVTGADGCYGGKVPVGSYQVAGARIGTPYEGGGTTPLLHPVSVSVDSVVTQDIALPPTGRLRVTVVDERNRSLPARIGVVGFDPSPEETITATGPFPDFLGTTGVFRDVGKDGIPFGFTRVEYAGASGSVEFDVEPGTYQVFVSRGWEYSLYGEGVTIVPGVTTQVEARITRVLDTTGFVSSDFHVHGIRSADSRIRNENRVLQFAGEGIDNLVMTDHNARTDLNPVIKQLKLGRFLHATVGEEITTWDYGHFNGYPYVVDPERPSGGSLDWGVAAPPGRDFPQYGAYILTPQELDEKGRIGPGTTPESLVQINHISSTFGPLKIDTSQVPPRSALSDAEKSAMRIDPAAGDLFHHFRAMELVNGDSQGSVDGFFRALFGIWLNHLNQGLHVTGVGVSDTHAFHNLNAAGARTWTASPRDEPRKIDSQDVAASVSAGRATLGMGAFVTTRLLAEDGSGRSAELGWGGSTLVTSASGGVSLEVTVQAPVWAPYDRIEIYANAPTQVSGTEDGVPVFFGASPTLVLHAGSDFAVERVPVRPEIPDAERYETQHRVPFANLEEDTWFVVAVLGSDGVSEPMFPVAPKSLAQGSNQTLDDLLDGNLGEGGTRAWGITNPLYADVDGVLGFQAPLAPGP